MLLSLEHRLKLPVPLLRRDGGAGGTGSGDSASHRGWETAAVAATTGVASPTDGLGKKGGTKTEILAVASVTDVGDTVEVRPLLPWEKKESGKISTVKVSLDRASK